MNHIKSLSFVEDVIPSYQAAVTFVSNNNSKPAGVLSIDPQKLLLIAPALELTQGSAMHEGPPTHWGPEGPTMIALQCFWEMT